MWPDSQLETATDDTKTKAQRGRQRFGASRLDSPLRSQGPEPWVLGARSVPIHREGAGRSGNNSAREPSTLGQVSRVIS